MKNISLLKLNPTFFLKDEKENMKEYGFERVKSIKITANFWILLWQHNQVITVEILQCDTLHIMYTSSGSFTSKLVAEASTEKTSKR